MLKTTHEYIDEFLKSYEEGNADTVARAWNMYAGFGGTAMLIYTNNYNVVSMMDDWATGVHEYSDYREEDTYVRLDPTTHGIMSSDRPTDLFDTSILAAFLLIQYNPDWEYADENVTELACNLRLYLASVLEVALRDDLMSLGK